MKRPIFFNEDCTFFIITQTLKDLATDAERGASGVTAGTGFPDIGEQELNDYIDMFKDTGITDFVLNVGDCGGGVSSYPSKTTTSLVDKYYNSVELGKMVNYKSLPFISLIHDLYVNKKIDMYKVWIDRCRKNSLNPWISFRMNDIHGTADNELPNYGKNSFFYDNFSNIFRIKHRKLIGYYDRCMDYGLPQVRKHVLEYIEETLERYDPYGIELDFQREALCFSPGKEYEGQEHITVLLKDIKSLITSAQKRLGHKIYISMRCVPKPEDSLNLGFDIANFSAQGLIDLVIPTPRWGNTSYDMPIKLWKQLVCGNNTLVGAGIEVEVQSNPFSHYQDRDIYHTIETLNGCLAYMHSQQADIIYLFNYMDFAQWLIKNQNSPAWNAAVPKRRDVLSVMKEAYALGDEEISLNTPRRHIPTCEDFVPPWRNAQAVLPQTSQNPNHVIQIRIATGKIPAGAEVMLKLGIDCRLSPSEAMTVVVNSTPVEYLGTESCGFPRFTDNELHCFKVINNKSLGMAQIVEFISTGKPVTVDHAEIDINLPSFISKHI